MARPCVEAQRYNSSLSFPVLGRLISTFDRVWTLEKISWQSILKTTVKIWKQTLAAVHYSHVCSGAKS
jgi:hypothetical protein